MDQKGTSAPAKAQETPPTVTPPPPGPDARKWLLVSHWRKLCHTAEPKDFWEGLKSIVVVVAIIVGGVWTGFTFSKLGSENKARAEIESLQAENARIRDQQSDLELSIEATQLKPPPNDKTHYLTVIATLRNIGTRNIVVCFEDPLEDLLPTNCPLVDSGQTVRRHLVAPITVTYARLNPETTKIVFDTPIPAELWREDDPKQPLKGLDLKVGQTELLATLVPLKEVGVYRIAFAVRESEESRMVASKLKPIWSISKFFVVRENSELESLGRTAAVQPMVR